MQSGLGVHIGEEYVYRDSVSQIAAEGRQELLLWSRHK